MNFSSLSEDIEDAPPSNNSTFSIKKVNSQVNIDEKTGKVVSTSASTDCDLATNIDVDDNKVMTQKILQLQTCSSLPDLQADEQTSSPSSTATISSNSNNQMQTNGHGKHVILAVESRDEDELNQMNGAIGGDAAHSKKKIKLNIDPAANDSSSSSSNNLESDNGTTSTTSTL
jgi:hypothetical protein